MSTRGLRVTGGRLTGRRLRVPGAGTRPTADRVRESLFARLGDFGGARVLDLYAGSGALGVEAASRGAARVVFVERAARCLGVLRGNLAALGLEDGTRVVADDVVRALRRLEAEGERFDAVFLDPPYGGAELARSLGALADSPLLVPGGTVVAEHHRGDAVPGVPGLAMEDSRRYGDTCVTRWVTHGDDPGGGMAATAPRAATALGGNGGT